MGYRAKRHLNGISASLEQLFPGRPELTIVLIFNVYVFLLLEI